MHCAKRSQAPLRPPKTSVATAPQKMNLASATALKFPAVGDSSGCGSGLGWLPSMRAVSNVVPPEICGFAKFWAERGIGDAEDQPHGAGARKCVRRSLFRVAEEQSGCGVEFYRIVGRFQTLFGKVDPLTKSWRSFGGCLTAATILTSTFRKFVFYSDD